MAGDDLIDETEPSMCLPDQSEAEKEALDNSEEVSLPEIPAIRALMEQVQAELAELKGILQAQSRTDNQSRIAFEKLHKEMLDYKEGFLQRAQEPMYRALIDVSDDIDRILSVDHPLTRDDLLFVQSQVLETLSRQGVEAFTCEVESFDGQRQKAEAVEPTDDQACHRKVLRSIKPGYRIEDRTVRPEGVVISVYRPENT